MTTILPLGNNKNNSVIIIFINKKDSLIILY